MATATQPNPANVLPDVETAQSVLFNGFGNHVFVQKLASYGYPITSEAQLQSLTKLADDLEAAEASGMLKRAAEADDPYRGAVDALGQTLDQYGIQRATHEEAAARKQAADYYAQDPALYNSVLALAAHDAQEIGKQFAAA